MSSVITGQHITDMTMPVTWAAFAAFVQVVVLVVPSVLWAGGISAKVVSLEKYKETHQVETVHRQEFDRQTVQLDRLEQKLDSLLLELRKGR